MLFRNVRNPHQRCPNRIVSAACRGYVRLPYEFCLPCLVGMGELNADGSEVTPREALAGRADGKPVLRQGGMVNVHTKPPAHYNAHPSGVECIEVTRHLPFNLGNVVKYIWRAGLKENESEIKDLEKSLDYLNDEINKRKLALGISVDGKPAIGSYGYAIGNYNRGYGPDGKGHQ